MIVLTKRSCRDWTTGSGFCSFFGVVSVEIGPKELSEKFRLVVFRVTDDVGALGSEETGGGEGVLIACDGLETGGSVGATIAVVSER